MRFTLLASVLVVGPLTGQTPEQRYFDWADLPFPADEYVSRRARLSEVLRQIGPGFLLVPSGPGISHGETFRPRNDFIYLTGLELPDALLVLDPESGIATVYVAPSDPRFENPSRRNDFPGRPLALDSLLERRTGLSIVPVDSLEALLDELAANRQHVRVNLGRSGSITQGPPDLMADLSIEEQLIAGLQSRDGLRVANAYEAIARVRMVKSDAEIRIMRRTAELTARAIEHAASFVRPGVDERTLAGELEASFKRQGAQRPAFASIIKSGPNSLWPWRILASHYNRRNRAMREGELVIFDVGAELDYYVSDVGRTFPVSGVFTPEQREILAMEVAVSRAIIAAVRPGVTFAELQTVAERAIPAEHEPYMQTGLFFGHHIGLDTGDPSLPTTPLEPGMIFTVEPWYYNHESGISVFTEDEVLVTTTGAEVLTARLPHAPEELERMMRSR